jgi:hypothetical protein
VARAIATRLEAAGAVRLIAVGDPAALDLGGVDLLVIGGPTQGHGARPALRTWIDRLPAAAVRGRATATFDTRLRWPLFLAGSAARAIASTLAGKGARLVMPPGSFFVRGSEEPLVDGELDRAGSWAATVAARAKASAAGVGAGSRGAGSS